MTPTTKLIEQRSACGEALRFADAVTSAGGEVNLLKAPYGQLHVAGDFADQRRVVAIWGNGGLRVIVKTPSVHRKCATWAEALEIASGEGVVSVGGAFEYIDQEIEARNQEIETLAAMRERLAAFIRQSRRDGARIRIPKDSPEVIAEFANGWVAIAQAKTKRRWLRRPVVVVEFTSWNPLDQDSARTTTSEWAKVVQRAVGARQS